MDLPFSSSTTSSISGSQDSLLLYHDPYGAKCSLIRENLAIKEQAFIALLVHSLVLLCDRAFAAKVVAYSGTKGSHASDKRGLLQRVTTVETLSNNATVYYASVEVGTPPQTLMLQLGIGSSDVWVLAKTASECMNSSQCVT